MSIDRALVVLFVAGITLFFARSSKPRFRDAASWPWVTHEDSPAFVATRERNRTSDGQIADLGVGLATLALSLAVAVAALGAHGWAAIRSLVTPSRKPVIIVLANLSLLGVFLGEFLGFVRDHHRGEFPPWADTPAIPMEWLISGWHLAAPVLTIGLTVCLWRARLPAALWRRPVGWWPWISTLTIGSLLAIEALLLTDAVRFGRAFAIPCHLAMLYWLLSGRAAAGSRRAA